MIDPKERARLADAIQAAWPEAQSLWAGYLRLTPPVIEDLQGAVALIDLATRQIKVSGGRVVNHDLFASIPALLAHEVGHHVRYPATLAVSARLELLCHGLIPVPPRPIVNLFTDLMVNEVVGRTHADQLCRIYRAFEDCGDAAFRFYLAVYEELWHLPEGQLMGAGAKALEKSHPGYRADAQILAQDLFRMGPNVYTQLTYFVSVLSRYVNPDDGDADQGEDPTGCSTGEPSPEDYAGALKPTQQEREAIRRALKEGWITQQDADRLDKSELERRIAGLPGVRTGEPVALTETMAAYYRREAAKYLVAPPPSRTLGQDIVPVTHRDWEPGDPVGGIDWIATLAQRGDRLGVSAPLARERLPDEEGLDAARWVPRVEIYLDVSGSMPDPRYTENAMTMAAQILSLATARAGGLVRALLYSVDCVQSWTWKRSEVEMSGFLLHYIGAGTLFPFEILEQSVAECGNDQPTRVVISDFDFLSNLDDVPRAGEIVARAAERSRPLVLLLAADGPPLAALAATGARVVRVDELADFPKLAAALARALFPERAVQP